MSKIIFDNVSLSYRLEDKEIVVFDKFNLEISSDELTMIIGKSGCGKTTLLRLLAKLVSPDSGKIIIPEDLKIGMMFQEPRLMPWLNVEKNISLGLKKTDKKEIENIVNLVGLSGFEKALPHQLSGGMQQRVSLARTLIRKSNLVLMDEPFSALDNYTRTAMQQELIRIRKQKQLGCIFVTHDINEATLLGDRIITLGSNTQ
jgi:sulfonate transport system ATP-binding protein